MHYKFIRGNDKHSSTRRHHAVTGSRRMVGYTIVLISAAACVGCWSKTEDVSDKPNSRPPPIQPTAPTDIERAQRLLAQGRHAEAIEIAQRILIASPDDTSALRVVAGGNATQGNFDDAATIAIRIASLDVPDPANELLQAFDWHLRAGKPQASENDLRHALKLAPDDPRVHRTMAQLLNSQGRRFEARPHVITLARLGVVTNRELLSLIDISGPFELASFEGVLPAAAVEAGTLFDLGKARHQFIADNDLDAALKTAERLRDHAPDNPAVVAFRGRLITEKGDDESFAQWVKQLPPGSSTHPEYWLAVGQWLDRHDRPREAVRAFGEALRLDPTDRRSLRTMSAVLDRLDEVDKARSARESLVVLDEIFRLAANADPSQAMWIAGELQKLVRPWESLGWYRHALQLQGNEQQRAAELDQRHHQIREWEGNATLDQIRRVRLEKLVGFDIDAFPLPQLDSVIPMRQLGDGDQQRLAIRFRDIAPAIGLDIPFVSDFPLESDEFYLYQSNGGGLAVLDYDCDGRPDLYVAQSGGDPRAEGTSTPNQLFRHLPDGTVSDVTVLSGTGDRGFGQGVCAGDVNQDGLADLLVANIGRNAVHINQGDGTFVQRNRAIGENAERWTSSLVLGDLDGDQLPDLVEVNYLDDPLIFERKCVGKNLACTPQRFRAATDRILRNHGDGTFKPWPGAERIEELPNYGFGAVIANFDQQHGNDLFVSNDGDVNHFWKSVAVNSDSDHAFVLQESAGITGCNVGPSGIVQACMGIASGDFDRNGLLDMLITNFHNEPLNLFLQNKSGFFVDDARKYGLVEPSLDVLGFGTQAADFDNDGWLDVAVLNGHIYDARYAGIPFRMKAQVFQGRRGGFVPLASDVAGEYWNREQLARTLALLDWNRDGKMDLCSNHLDQPLALLLNDSESENWLQIELVGTASERDGTGSTVTVTVGDETWKGWQIGGDGYMCSNESVIALGIAAAQRIDKLEIEFPSGHKQSWSAVRPNQRYLVIEGQQELFAR